MAVKAPSAAFAWMAWLLLLAGWLIMLSGVSALQNVGATRVLAPACCGLAAAAAVHSWLCVGSGQLPRIFANLN
jgi:hypothetical protein